MWVAHCGLAWAEPGLLLQSESITVDVSGHLAEIVFTQRFQNNSDEFIHGTYEFPLDAGAAVDNMVLSVGDVAFESRIVERYAAREAFDAAADEGKVAALTEQRRPNLFVQSVANLPPGELVEVELHVIQPVHRVDGAWELVLPLVVGPRFVAEGEGDLGAPYAWGVNNPGITADVSLVIHAGAGFPRLTSPTHALSPTLEGSTVLASLTGITLDRDVVVRWTTVADAPVVGLAVAGDIALLTIEAPIDLPFERRVPREMVWIVDTSGSMKGAPIEIARAAMTHALMGMDEHDSFAIVPFSNDVRPFAPIALPADRETVAEGLGYITQLSASGGTQLAPAMRYAFDLQPDPLRRRTIVLLSDGLIDADTALLEELASRVYDVTMVTLGIGHAPNRFLMDELALLGGGVSAYALLDEDPVARMKSLVEAMDRPVLTSIRWEWPGCTLSNAAPRAVPTLRAGQPTVVLARVSGMCSGPAVVTALGASGRWAWTVFPTVFPEGRALQSSWARAQVEDLIRQYRNQTIPDPFEKILELGLANNIVTEQTSFVVADSRVVNPGGVAQTQQQWLSPTAGGQVLSKEYLQRVPAGRSYQQARVGAAGVTGAPTTGLGSAATNTNEYMLDGANISDPVTGTFSTNFDFGALIPTVPVHPVNAAASIELACIPTNTLESALGVQGAWTNASQLGAAGHLCGPIVRDRWFASAELGALASSIDEVDAETVGGGLGMRWIPNAFARAHVTGSVEHGSVADDALAVQIRREQALAELALFPTSMSHWTIGVDAADTSVGDQERRTFAAHAVAEGPAKFAGKHALVAALQGATYASSNVARTETWSAGRLSVGDTWTPHRSIRVMPGARLDVVAGQLAWVSPSPAVGVDWHSNNHRAAFQASYVRNVDAANRLPDDLADVTVPIRNALSASAGFEVVTDLALDLQAAWEREAFAFAVSPDIVPLPEAAVASIRRAFPSLALGLRKVLARRWTMHIRGTYLPLAASATSDLLRNPLAPYVPGFLDAFRTTSFDTGASWDLPTDPWRLSLGGSVHWTSAVEGGTAWWNRDTTSARASLQQHIDVRKGEFIVGLEGVFAVRDIEASLLPLEALVLLPNAPSPGEQPATRLDLALTYAY